MYVLRTLGVIHLLSADSFFLPGCVFEWIFILLTDDVEAAPVWSKTFRFNESGKIHIYYASTRKEIFFSIEALQCIYDEAKKCQDVFSLLFVLRGILFFL